MQQCAHPNLGAMRSAEVLFPHESVEAPIPFLVLPPGDIPPQLILFHPVNLKISKGFTIPEPNDREAVFAAQGSLEESFLVFPGAGCAPEVVDAGLVHPVVEQVGVAWLDRHVSKGGEVGVCDTRIGW